MTMANPYSSSPNKGNKCDYPPYIIPYIIGIFLTFINIIIMHHTLKNSFIETNQKPSNFYTQRQTENSLLRSRSIYNQQQRLKNQRPLQDKSLKHQDNNSNQPFIPTLRNKRIFFEVVTVGLKQFSYLEDIIDSVRDLCEAGAHVSFHVTSSNCDPNGATECEIRNQESNTTYEDNFSVETISHLNERVQCRNPEGSLEMTIHLISPDWGKQICDHHRLLFYENIDKGYDVFVHTEDDELIRPTQIIAFLDEMNKLRQLVGDERLPDYSIGFMRYENQISVASRRRVIWEFEWDWEVEMVNHPGIEGLYFISPDWHHQGMFMATPQQLLAWKTRGPDCHFHKIKRRSAWHTERISGALDLYDTEFCNVTQLLPLDSVEDLLVHHLPNKNNVRTTWKVEPTRNIHKMRLQQMQKTDENVQLWTNSNNEYNGIKMIIDERDPNKKIHFDLTDYNKYIQNGRRLTSEQLELWEPSKLEKLLSEVQKSVNKD